jgi:hypothetical protein
MGSSDVFAEHCSYTDTTYGEGQFFAVADNGDILTGTYTNGLSLSGPPIIGFKDDITF